MLPTNQAGEIITPENVFHGLITRLVKLNGGLRRSNEIEVNYKEIIDEIEDLIYGYNSKLVLPLIAHAEELIRRIEEAEGDFFRNIDVKWDYTDGSKIGLPEIVKTELVYYTISIQKIKEHFYEMQQHQDYTTELTASSERMKINISVPKLSMLVHLLVGDHNEFDKIINADKRMFAHGLIAILEHQNGERISENSLRDKWSDERTMESTLQFWKERFNDYRTKCINIMREKGFV